MFDNALTFIAALKCLKDEIFSANSEVYTRPVVWRVMGKFNRHHRELRWKSTWQCLCYHGYISNNRHGGRGHHKRQAAYLYILSERVINLSTPHYGQRITFLAYPKVDLNVILLQMTWVTTERTRY